MITGVGKVVVAVDDQDNARAFWTDQIGFDATVDEAKWRRALDRGDPARGVPGPGAQAGVPQGAPGEVARSGLIFTRDDLQQTGQDRAARGASFPVPPARMPFVAEVRGLRRHRLRAGPAELR
jgi:hypothetical protein